MEKGKKRIDIPFALLCAVFAAAFMTALDCVLVYLGYAMALKMFVCVMAAAVVLLYAVCCRRFRKAVAVGTAAILGVWILAAVGFACWHSFSENAVYADADMGKEQLYAGKRIMMIVPHEDDEINLLGGVTEEYIKYGSEVFAVFVTNGDSDFPGSVRIEEAVAAMGVAGVPEDHIVFLGYGDQWASGGPHIYNAEPGTVVKSVAGNTAVYATEEHPAYREGQPYTVDNLLKDLEDVMLEYRPDIIFCSDYDLHIDHRAVSLAFEKAVGNMLKNQTDYRPVILKGYAYGTAWAAEPDYYTVNLERTKNVYEEPANQEPEIYRWEERVRLPVQSSVLSRSVVSSRVYQSLDMHKSQNAVVEAKKIINGDKVFWYRDPNSLSYGAEVTVTSGNAGLLTDFMLVDNRALTDDSRLPYDGVWIPEDADTQKQIRISFAEPVAVGLLTFYDHPSLTDNILDLEIAFDDGTAVHTGALDPRGCVTRMEVEKTEVRWMEIRVADWEGELAGLSELEIFASETEHGFDFIKLMDTDGNFVYDFWTKKDGTAVLTLYKSGEVPDIGEGSYTVTTDNPDCEISWEGENLIVFCPVGDNAVITVESKDGSFADSIAVSNPGTAVRLWTGLWQKVEEAITPYYFTREYRKTIIYRLTEAVLG